MHADGYVYMRKAPCKERGGQGRSARSVLDQLFANNAAAAVRHRLAICCQASPCKHLCERLVKGPGKIAWCLDIKTGKKVALYEALERPDFHCPASRF